MDNPIHHEQPALHGAHTEQRNLLRDSLIQVRSRHGSRIYQEFQSYLS
jgi:hypothetical protein